MGQILHACDENLQNCDAALEGSLVIKPSRSEFHGNHLNLSRSQRTVDEAAIDLAGLHRSSCFLEVSIDGSTNHRSTCHVEAIG